MLLIASQVLIEWLQLSIRDGRQKANAWEMSRFDRCRTNQAIQVLGMFERMENVARLYDTHVERAQNRYRLVEVSILLV